MLCLIDDRIQIAPKMCSLDPLGFYDAAIAEIFVRNEFVYSYQWRYLLFLFFFIHFAFRPIVLGIL
jgi:hypothetical protein